ncbi:MAG: metallophosphoesterase [Gemmatimonadota bacterium]|nr:metallophosphoesterase [Gemmatimonadota bacterium]
MSSNVSPSERQLAHKLRLSRRQFIALGGAGAIVGVPYSAYSNSLEVVRTSDPGKPAGAAPVRIAQLTDLHAPHNWIHDEQVIDEVRRFDPHLVFITGDAVDRRGNEHLVDFYGRLPARTRRYAILGNWEYQGSCDFGALRRRYEHAGVRLLINEREAIEVEGRPFDVLGLDDWRRGRPLFQLLEGTPRDGERTLLLEHCPISLEHLLPYPDRRISMFSGHTHGGQIAPLGLALILPEGSGGYVSGWYHGDSPDHHMYVSRGLGHTLIPFRLGARPELTLITA